MNLIIFSDFDCVLCVEGKIYSIKSGLEKDVPLCKDNAFFAVYPASSGGLENYSFEISKNVKDFNSNNAFAKIYNFNKDNFLLRLHKKHCVNTMITLDKISTLFNDYEVYQGELLNIICGEKVIITRNIVCNKASVSSYNNLVFFELFSGDKNHLIVLNTQNEIVLEDDVFSVEQIAQGFLTLTKFANMQKQGIVKKYQFSNEKLTLTEQYAVYLKNTPKKLYNPLLSKLAFFESVKAKNLSLCKQYLSQELANKISQNHLLKYFGDFDEIYDLSHFYNQNTITVLDNKSGVAKTFLIDMQNQKISNILLLE